MADWRKVVRAHPATRDYARHCRWSRRGDVVVYAPDISCASFSTDAYGFRRSVYAGVTRGMGDIADGGSFGIVAGSSHVFGFGLPGDAATLSSQLSSRLDLPMANLSFPEADTRTLHAVLTNLCLRGMAPKVVFLATGGDFTRHAYAGISDPVFGSPNVKDARPPTTPATPGGVLAFSELWTRSLVAMVRGAGARVVLIDDATFLDKSAYAITSNEAACGLGRTGAPQQLARFEFQRVHGPAFFSMRRALADDLNVPIAGLAPESLDFIDEYHMTGPAIAALADRVAKTAMEAVGEAR